MSINLMNMIWSDRSGQLTLSETAILVRMASFAIEDGSSIYPSLQRIASDCKGTRRGIMKIIDSLIAKGYLQKIIRKTPDTNLTNYYYINTQKFNNDLLVNKPLSKKLSPEAVSESVENFKNPVDNNSEMVGNINSTDYLSGEQYSPGVVNHVHPKETNKEILLLKEKRNDYPSPSQKTLLSNISNHTVAGPDLKQDLLTFSSQLTRPTAVSFKKKREGANESATEWNLLKDLPEMDRRDILMARKRYKDSTRRF